MPTRPLLPTPVPLPSSLLQKMRQALRAGDIKTAHRVWIRAHIQAPRDGSVLREGARLALAQGNLSEAERRAWAAVEVMPEDAEVWALLGVVLARKGATRAASQALGVAQSLDPVLADQAFTERWQAARRANDGNTMWALAQAYGQAYPDAPMAFYYRAAALLATGDVETAMHLLIPFLESSSDAPAVLWQALGEAYAARGAWAEAATALEIAGAKAAQGDRSLYAASLHPAHTLTLALADAYLHTGRCIEAASLYRRMSTPYPEVAPRLTEAIHCQTPTPTWTPWLPSQQVTPTPFSP